MKRKSLITVIVCLIICGILVGCGQSTAADISDKAVEETKVEEKAPKKKEKKKSEEKKAFDTKAAQDSLKEMSEALSGFLWASIMKESEYNSMGVTDFKLPLSSEEKIRAAVLNGDADGVIDSTFVLDMGGFSEDKNADVGPGGDGYHGFSVSQKSVEQNCLDLFGTKVSFDDLPVGPVCDLFDAVRYEDEDGSYALIVDREEETETALENHECTVEEEDGKYIGTVNMFWGYWGEIEQKPGYSNYVATYTLEPNDESKYGMVVKEIEITPLFGDSGEYLGDDDVQDGFDASDEPFYGLWVGSSTERQESLDLVKDLKDKGLDAYCIYTPEWENLNRDSYWCVTVGKSASKERAEELIADVEQAGYKGAYVKYTGERLGHRIYYYVYAPSDVVVTPSKVTLEDVTTVELSGSEEDEGPMTLIVDSDTVFDKTCDMQYFPGYKEGQSPLEWYNSASETDLMGVFEVSIEGNHVESFYGSYWWD